MLGHCILYLHHSSPLLEGMIPIGTFLDKFRLLFQNKWFLRRGWKWYFSPRDQDFFSFLDCETEIKAPKQLYKKFEAEKCSKSNTVRPLKFD